MSEDSRLLLREALRKTDPNARDMFIRFVHASLRAADEMKQQPSLSALIGMVEETSHHSNDTWAQMRSLVPVLKLRLEQYGDIGGTQGLLVEASQVGREQPPTKREQMMTLVLIIVSISAMAGIFYWLK